MRQHDNHVLRVAVERPPSSASASANPVSTTASSSSSFSHLDAFTDPFGDNKIGGGGGSGGSECDSACWNARSFWKKLASAALSCYRKHQRPVTVAIDAVSPLLLSQSTAALCRGLSSLSNFTKDTAGIALVFARVHADLHPSSTMSALHHVAQTWVTCAAADQVCTVTHKQAPSGRLLKDTCSWTVTNGASTAAGTTLSVQSLVSKKGGGGDGAYAQESASLSVAGAQAAGLGEEVSAHSAAIAASNTPVVTARAADAAAEAAAGLAGLTFSVKLRDEEKAARDGMQLPYTMPDSAKRAALANSRAGIIEYEHDALDDLLFEDPDGDLGI